MQFLFSRPLPIVMCSQSFQSQRRNYSKRSDCRIKRRTRKPRPPSETMYPRHLVPRLCRTYSVSIQSFNQQRIDPTNFVAPPTTQKLPQRSNPKVKRTKNKPELKDASTQTDVLLRITTIKPTLRKRLKPEVQFDRFSVTTGFVHSKNRNMETNKDANIPDAEFPHLFKNDLIDIIGEKHDKMLKTPQSTNRERQFPLLNLFTPFRPGQLTAGSKKIRPWR